MHRKTKAFCFIIAIIFLVSCFTAVSAYASTDMGVTGDAQAGLGNIANDMNAAGQNPEGSDKETDSIPNQETDSAGNDIDSTAQTQSTDIQDTKDKSETTQDEIQDETIQDPTQDTTTQDTTTQDQVTQDQNANEDSDKDADQSDAEDEPDKTPSDPDKDTSSASKTTSGNKPKNEESLWYIPRIPMKKEHQKVLWDYCKLRKIDYIDMLALIATESNFNEKANGKYKGYFQISSGTGAKLAKALKTPNTPLNGKVNINWGTALYSSILKDKRVKNLTGKKKRDAALSIFQRGTIGYDRYGISTGYLKVYYKKWNIISSYSRKA